MMTYLRRLVDERTNLTQLATQLAERAATEDRDLTDTERATLAGYQTRCDALDAQITEHNAQVTSQRAYAALLASMPADNDQGATRPPANLPARRESAAVVPFGRAFTDSQAFREYRGYGASGRVELAFPTRAAEDPIKLGDLITQPYVFLREFAAPASPLLDVISTETVSSNDVQYMTYGPDSNYPPVVPEGTLKPAADLPFAKVSTALETYAWWKAITRQALEDVPRIQSIIETRLQAGITRALEAAVATALTGATLAVAQAPAVPVGSPVPQLLANIRVGLGQVQAMGYTPNAVLLNPADMALIDLGMLQSTLNGPTATGPLWGVRVVAVPELLAGTAYVGDFATGITLFRRSSTEVMLTDSHADFFLRNQLVILAEARAHAAVIEPPAMVEVPDTAAVVGP